MNIGVGWKDCTNPITTKRNSEDSFSNPIISTNHQLFDCLQVDTEQLFKSVSIGEPRNSLKHITTHSNIVDSSQFIAKEEKMLNGQTKIVSNDVNHQTATSVAKSATPNAGNGNNMSVSEQGQNSNRAQDDHMVSYVFQRQNDSDFQNYGKSSRWFAGEESNLMDVRLFLLFCI